ncbi:TPA: glycosyltransferase, partial [Haemophilus influenzae]
MKKRNLFRKKFKNNAPRNERIDVSIIIPMYNVENLIGETIECLKNNFCKMEVLLIDDGSKDNTVNNAKLAVANDKRFTILRKENSGVSSTRNFGIKKAKGEFIFFCDSDDILEENAIDKLLIAAFAENADYIYGGIKKFNKEKEWTIPVHDKNNLFLQGTKTIDKNTELFLSMSPGAKLIHRSLLKNKFFPEDIHCAEDQVIFFNIFLYAKKIYCIGNYIYKYRERDLENNERSITQQRDIKAFAFFIDILSVIEINRKVLEESALTDSQKKLVLKAYFERALTFDVWPLFLRVLKFDNKKSSEAITLIINLINSVDKEFLNYTPGFRYFFLRVLIDNIDYISIKDYLLYKSLVALIISNLQEETIEVCENSPNWGNRLTENKSIIAKNGFLNFLLLRQKKKLFRFLNRNREFIGKNLFFPLMKLIPINKNKIVFATSSKGKASSNFTYLLNELKKDNKNYEIKKFLGLSNELKRNLYRYYHLATAGTIFLESYYSPLYNVKLRKSTKVVQLWHACGGFKKFAYSSLGQGDANSEEFEYHAH